MDHENAEGLRNVAAHWAAFNLAGAVGNVPWVPILSAVLYLLPRLFELLKTLVTGYFRRSDLARDLVAARRKIERLECEAEGYRLMLNRGENGEPRE